MKILLEINDTDLRWLQDNLRIPQGHFSTLLTMRDSEAKLLIQDYSLV